MSLFAQLTSFTLHNSIGIGLIVNLCKKKRMQTMRTFPGLATSSSGWMMMRRRKRRRKVEAKRRSGGGNEVVMKNRSHLSGEACRMVVDIIVVDEKKNNGFSRVVMERFHLFFPILSSSST